MKKRCLFAGMLVFCLLGLVFFTGGQKVSAEGIENFSGTVSVVKQEANCYIVQVEVGSSSEDFDGMVRLAFKNSDCVFDTRLTLPAQGKKQFTLTVPQDSVDQLKGSGNLIFLDNDEEELQRIPFKNILQNVEVGIRVGVLSDSFDKLTYMDMSGNGYMIINKPQAINLVELDKDNLKDSLEGLYFLIIDSYDVGSLDKDSLTAIEDWVSQGGALIIGTGARGEETLNAFDRDFTGLAFIEASQPGENNYLSSLSGMYYNYEDGGIDFNRMSIATLGPAGNSASVYTEANENPGAICNFGNGGILVLAFSLCEDEMQKAPSELCQTMYDEVFHNASPNGVTIMDSYSDMANSRANCFGIIDYQNTSLNFSWLEGMICIYVLLAGPVLYLILISTKKRDWYWIGVPVLAIVFIGAVLVFGRDLRVADTKVYSVTAQRLDGQDNKKINTYYSAYHSGVKPWQFELDDRYAYGGSDSSAWMYSGGNAEYRVIYDEGIKLGMDPSSNFETGHMFATGTGEEKGKILAENLVFSRGASYSVTGSITNNTEYDMPYMLVMLAEDCTVFIKDVKKGETVNISEAIKQKRAIVRETYLYDYYFELRSSSTIGIKGDEDDTDLYAALVIGAYDAAVQCEAGQAVVCGVVPDYEKTVSGKCTEVSYGCLYSMVEQKEVAGVTN